MEDFKAINRSKDQGSIKSLLKKGMVPGIIYGKNTDPTKIAFSKISLMLFLLLNLENCLSIFGDL